ncbi:hypothetical protein D3C72_1504680 [compost metagenome]
MATLSLAPDDASAAWVARSFMRISMVLTSSNAPSAVCSIEVLFCVLRMATVMPLACARSRVAICRPAASSMAELMRKPVERRVIDVDSRDCARAAAFCAASAAVFV